MSELKVYRFLGSDEVRADATIGNDFYLKSEADKVIAELKNNIEEQKRLRNMALASVPNVLKVMKIIQHQKHKRCLAMAQWCKDKVDAIKNGYIRSSIESRKGIMTTCPPECNPKFSFYSKWYKRWLELAAEPTWAKFLQLIHKEAK